MILHLMSNGRLKLDARWFRNRVERVRVSTASNLCFFARCLVLLVLTFSASPVLAGTIYVLSGQTGSPNFPRFGSIDVTTGVYSEITPSLSSQYVRNLAWNPSTSSFYTVLGDPDGDPVNVNLATLSTAGSIATIGDLLSARKVVGMAYRQADSTLYGFDRDGNDFGEIDPASGLWTTINPAGHGISDQGRNGGRFAILNDTLYLTNNDQFGTIGYDSSSSFSQVGSSNNLFVNMVLATDGTSLFGVYGNGTEGQQSLYDINPTTGNASFNRLISGAGLGTRFYGADFGPTSPAVPEPTSMAIYGLGALGMAYGARRKSKAQA